MPAADAETTTPPPPVVAEQERVETAPPPAIATSDEAGCAERAYPIARASAVRVASGGRHGAGVIVLDGRHVATALWIVEHGHGIEVTDADGNERHARIILTADEDGLAMLELDAALPGRPLGVAEWEAVRVGRPVVVVGVPSPDAPRGAPGMARGTAPWAASAGIVSARGDRAIQVDAALSAPIGSPIVDCDGALVGVVGRTLESPMGSYVVMPGVPAIIDLASRADHPEGYGGRWALTGGISLGAVYEDPQWLWGASITLGVIALDAVVLAVRGHYYWNDDSPLGGDVLSVHRSRIRGDAFLAWRQILVFGRMAMHFELGAGASVTRWREETRRGEIDSSTGAPTLRWTATNQEDWSVRPMVLLNLIHGPAILSYTLELDIDREHLMHVFAAGVRM